MRFLLIVSIFVGLPMFASAQEATSDFTIRVFGASDTATPTAPVIFDAVPVSSSQIDLTWSTSTDNFTVFGYVVFRDGSPIASTTVTNYSDTGLAASTTFTYEVAAFDGVPNYSATSSPVATTTQDISIPPATTSTSSSNSSSGGATVARVVLDSFAVTPGVATATLDMTTKRPARIEVRLGTTSSYELAYIVGNEFKTSHNVWLNDLVSNTTYFYEVVGYTPSGAQTILRQGSFTTLDDTPPAPPANVARLLAVQMGDDVQLSYVVPASVPPGAIVRAVRSHFGYPQFVNDGVVVYEGTEESVTDVDVFARWDRVYYTVFVIDPEGLVSSGAIVAVSDTRVDTTVDEYIPPAQGSDPVDEPNEITPVFEPDQEPAVATATPTSTPDIDETPTPVIDGFPVTGDFTISQGVLVESFSVRNIPLSAIEPFTVSVASSALTGDFKTIVATLYDPRESGRSFSFLLRLNGDRSAYEATIAPLQVAGTSDIVVEVFDYDTRVISAYETTLQFTGAPTATSTELTVWYWRLQTWLWAVLLFVPFAVLTSLWVLFKRREMREDEDNDTAAKSSD